MIPCADQSWVDLVRAVETSSWSGQKVARHSVVLASHTKMTHLGDLDRRLHNVVAAAPMTTMVGAEHGRAVLLGSQPNPADVVEEVRCYVRSLLAKNDIDFDRSVRTPDRDKGEGILGRLCTHHVIEDVGGTRILRRKCFCCDRRSRHIDRP